MFDCFGFFSVFVKFLKFSLPSLITKNGKMRSGRGDGLEGKPPTWEQQLFKVVTNQQISSNCLLATFC